MIKRIYRVKSYFIGFENISLKARNVIRVFMRIVRENWIRIQKKFDYIMPLHVIKALGIQVNSI